MVGNRLSTTTLRYVEQDLPSTQGFSQGGVREVQLAAKALSAAVLQSIERIGRYGTLPSEQDDQLSEGVKVAPGRVGQRGSTCGDNFILGRRDAFLGRRRVVIDLGSGIKLD